MISISYKMTKMVPAYERPLFEQFNKIYNTLSSLKNNRTKYINSKQIYGIYDEFLSLLHELTLSRKDEELKGITLNLPNANDMIIDDVWQLLSLCFVTCGLIKFAPATYSSLSTVYKLLLHLKECKVYTADDINPIEQRLKEIRDIIDTSEAQAEDEDIIDEHEEEVMRSHKREESLLLRNKLQQCEQLLNDIKDGFKKLPSDLESTNIELLQIRKLLFNYMTKTNNEATFLTQNDFNVALDEVKSKLKEIESRRDLEGRFVSKVGTPEQVDTAQLVLNGLLDDCNNLVNDVSIQKNSNNISDMFQNLDLSDSDSLKAKSLVKQTQDIYTSLIEVKLKLENLLITRRWTMRETDLYTFQKQLKTIEDTRVKLKQEIGDQEFTPNQKSSLKKLHMLVLYLLRRCYSLIYKLLESSEPVLESLQPIHNQLSTVRRCLLEIKRVDGLNNLRDIYPFQFKLASLDNLRVDGKFIINGQIPEGQGTLNALLAECFDILHELKIELEEKEEQKVASSSSGLTPGDKTDDITDDDDINSDDEVELKRNRYVGFNEADYDKTSASDLSDEEYESNDYY